MKQIIAECSCTLSDGAILKLRRVRTVSRQRGGGIPFTELLAERGEVCVKMKVQDVQQQTMETLLGMIRTAIEKRRVTYTANPGYEIPNPQSVNDFTHNMAAVGMFFFWQTPASLQAMKEAGALSTDLSKQGVDPLPGQQRPASPERPSKRVEPTLDNGGRILPTEKK